MTTLDYYYDRKARGMCVICREPASTKADGTKYIKCDRCREYERAARESLAVSGLCKSCGMPLNGDKHKRCEVCRKLDRARCKKYYYNKKERKQAK